MSLLVFSGVAQFATLDFWGDDIAWTSLALVVFAVSARHIVMGAALSPWLNRLPVGERLGILCWLSDPNFAHSQTAFRGGERDVGVLLGGGLALWVNWIAGTMVGVLTGSVIGDVSVDGFDVVMVCFFAAIVAGEARQTAALAPIAVAALVALFSLHWLLTGWNVIAAALAGGVVSVMRDVG